MFSSCFSPAASGGLRAAERAARNARTRLVARFRELILLAMRRRAGKAASPGGLAVATEQPSRQAGRKPWVRERRCAAGVPTPTAWFQNRVVPEAGGQQTGMKEKGAAPTQQIRGRRTRELEKELLAAGAEQAERLVAAREPLRWKTSEPRTHRSWIPTRSRTVTVRATAPERCWYLPFHF